MRSIVSFIADKEQKKDTAQGRQCQTNVLDTKTLRDLTQQPIDWESDDEEEVQVDERECVAVGDAGVAREFAQPKPKSSVLGHSTRRPDMTKCLKRVNSMSLQLHINRCRALNKLVSVRVTHLKSLAVDI